MAVKTAPQVQHFVKVGHLQGFGYTAASVIYRGKHGKDYKL
jgi:hypothetical protein